ncbi:MAG: GNAT family N-acetyltransferase [Actinomycetota bacterium]|nr:GNAT family N-acetyltransferase [Actinomycetota bacterium]
MPDEVITLVTPRLLLRQWREDDLAPFHAMSTDPVVMEHFPALSTYDQTREALSRHRDQLLRGKPGLYAVERRDNHEFIGFTGLAAPAFQSGFTPCVEIGWRLVPEAWGNGFATEGARACLAHGFDVLGLDEIVSFTSRANLRSQAVMRRLGMHTDPADDFDHPDIAAGHPLAPHVLYRIRVAQWRETQPSAARPRVTSDTGTPMSGQD